MTHATPTPYFQDLQSADWDFGTTCKPARPQPSHVGANSEGGIYFLSSRSDVVTADDSQYVAVKIGLFNGGEQEATDTINKQSTPNSGDMFWLHLLPVSKNYGVGRVEAFFHDTLRKAGYSTLAYVDPDTGLAWNRNVPERYRGYYSKMMGGKEWFIITRNMLRKYYVAAMKRFPFKGAIQSDESYTWLGKSSCYDALKFKFNSDGMPIAEMNGRKKKFQAQKLLLSWAYRTLTGHAPSGCCSLDVHVKGRHIL
jgi:hypothetical protein